jgi:hypothetical protein
VISSFGRAARGVSVGRAGDMVLAVVEANDRTAAVLSNGTVVTLSLDAGTDGTASLVCDGPGGRSVLASGGIGAMEDLRRTVSLAVARSARRGKGSPASGRASVCLAAAGLATLATAFLVAPGPSGPAMSPDALARMASQMQAAGPQSPVVARLPAPPATAPIPSVDRIPAGGPVSLDEAQRPAAALAPVGAAGTPTSPRPASAAASAEPDPRIVALRDAVDTLRRGGKVKAETLKLLPPDLARQVVQTGHAEVQALSAAALRSAGHDSYGTPDVPEDGTWAALGADHVPLPGGGDIKTPDDMKSFGFDPGTDPGK